VKAPVSTYRIQVRPSFDLDAVADVAGYLHELGADWVYLSPSVRLLPGTRTGKYRVGTDRVLYDSNGVSAISLEDYAVAMVDELEQPQHHRERFTVGY